MSIFKVNRSQITSGTTFTFFGNSDTRVTSFKKTKVVIIQFLLVPDFVVEVKKISSFTGRIPIIKSMLSP